MRILAHVLLTLGLVAAAAPAESAPFIRHDLEQMLHDNETDRIYCDLNRFKAGLPKIDPAAEPVMRYCQRKLARDITPRRVRPIWRETLGNAVDICNHYRARTVRNARGDFLDLSEFVSFSDCVERELRR